MSPPVPSTSAIRATRIVIAGAGPAAQALVSQLDRARFAGTITVLSSREDTPAELLKLAMLPQVSVRFGQPASHIDAVNRTVTTADGMDFAYDQLVVATGSAAVASPVEGAGRCLSYSTIDDAADLAVLAEERESRDDLAASAGLETAAIGGIVISQDFRTSVPGIWAIGDAAAFDSVRLGLLVAAASAAGACATQLVTAA